MAKKTLRGGIVVEYPDNLNLSESSGSEESGLHAARVDSSEERDATLKAVIESSEFTSVVAFQLEGGVGQDRLNALEDDSSPEEVTVRLPVEADEAAVMLSESDGVIRWEYPERIEEEPQEAAGLGAAPAKPKRVALFKSRYRPVVNADEKPEALGFIGDFLLKPVKKLILRFTARKVAETVSSYLEKSVSEGLRILTRGDGGQLVWKSASSLAEAWTPNGPKSILLFVHGTFSSTEGSFGGLATTDHGEDFLTRACDKYDAVISYDHKTLTKTVRENAADLLARLETLPTGEVAFDAVAYSRGGLVLRYLTEAPLPGHARPFKCRSAVFVGCTNGGTKLADPKHWKELIDLYTNLVSGAGRIVSVVGGPSTKVAATIVSGALRGALSFVRYLATETTTGEAIPGLASMDPNGDDVQDINQRQPGQPLPAQVNYYIVDADFDHNLFDEPKLAALGLKKRVFLEFADNFIDNMFHHVENDLVVDRASMSHIDPWSTEDWIKQRHPIEKHDGVYHTIYFNNPQVAGQIASWLL